MITIARTKGDTERPRGIPTSYTKQQSQGLNPSLALEPTNFSQLASADRKGRRKAKPIPGYEFGSDAHSCSPLNPRLLPSVLSYPHTQPSQNSDVAKGLSRPPTCPLSSQGYQCIDWQG